MANAEVSRSALFAELYPFPSHFVDCAGRRMHYVAEGAGRPVVFVHGNPTWSFYFRELIKGLRDTHRVIAPDHIGCGLSDKPQRYPYTLCTHVESFGRLMDRLSLSDITLAVHDWGGPIGLGWAVRNPSRVRSLVIFNTAAFLQGDLPLHAPRAAPLTPRPSPHPPISMPLRIRMSRWPIVGSIGVRGLNLFARAALRMACAHRERMTPQVAAGYLYPYDNYANRVAILRFVQDIPFHPGVPSYAVMAETERLLPNLAGKPMILFWGAKDFVFTDAYLTVWQRRFPQAVVHRFADAGHYVVEDAHERILPELKGFLQKNSQTVSVPQTAISR